MAIYLPSSAEEEQLALDELTPREIVVELDKHVIGQNDAKRAVAIALRNRTRRQRCVGCVRPFEPHQARRPVNWRRAGAAIHGYFFPRRGGIVLSSRFSVLSKAIVRVLSDVGSLRTEN